jgi:hypothetical protein
MALWRLRVRQEGYRTIEDLEADLTSMVNLLVPLRHLVGAPAVKTDLTSHNGTHVMRAPVSLQEVLSTHQRLSITADSKPRGTRATGLDIVSSPAMTSIAEY